MMSNNSFLTRGKQPNGNSIACATFLVFGLTVLACVPAIARVLLTPEASGVRCKYSVRDVAFVNVHGKAWHLQLIKPADVEPRIFDAWSETLKIRLDNSNVGFIWHHSDSDEAIRLVAQSSASESSPTDKAPLMFLTSPDEATIQVSKPREGESFGDLLDRLVDSPTRHELLGHLVDSLCVVLLVESGEETDDAANLVVEGAVDKLNKQMWTLEKRTEKGPVIVKVSARSRAKETWLLGSLGIRNDLLPAVAVVYGQGRRLGEVLTGDDITVDKIVGRASVCGQDCECDLNRDWLYRQQMIHVWSNELERKAERSLSFDPKSAFVIAEVAQIIQKNSTATGISDRVNLGGGLVIHNLDGLSEFSAPAESDKTLAELKTNDASAPALVERSNSSHDVNTIQKPAIPWMLLTGLFVALVAVSIWFSQRAGQR